MTAEEPGAGTGMTFMVRIGSSHFDPIDTMDPTDLVEPGDGSSQPSLRSRPGGGGVDAGGPEDTRLVQFHHPLTADEVERFRRDFGLALTRCFPPGLYVERVPTAVRPRLAADPAVRAVAPYRPDYKWIPRETTSAPDPLGPDRYLALLFDRGDPERVRSTLVSLGATEIVQWDNEPAGTGHRFTFVAPPDFDIDRLAELADVSWIQPLGRIHPPGPAEGSAGRAGTDDGSSIQRAVTPNTGGNVAAAGIHQSGDVNSHPIWAQGIRGELQTISIHEGGPFDMAHAFFRRQLVPKVTYHDPGLPTQLGLHASMIAGVAAGDIPNPGSHPDRGSAFAASLTSEWSGRIPGEPLAHQLIAGHFPGAFIHNFSFGALANAPVELQGVYDATCSDVDDFCHVFESHLCVASTPNSAVKGESPRRIESPGSAKSTVCVLAAKSPAAWRDFGSGVSGPTGDRRRKPDLCAIGGGMDVVKIRTGVGAGTDHDDMEALDGSHTSVATAQVSGAAALIRQYFTEGWYPTGSRAAHWTRRPTGALLKAMLVASCVDMGTARADRSPSNTFGWGMIKLDNVLAFGPDQSRLKMFDVRHKQGMTTGGNVLRSVTVADEAADLTVVLAYSDAPAPPGSSPATVNVLNLKVTAPDGATWYLGNTINPLINEAQSPPNTGTPDALNPLEVVKIKDPPPGNWTIEVSAPRVPLGPQGYALVIVGDLEEPAAPPPPPPKLTVETMTREAAVALVPIGRRLLPALPDSAPTRSALTEGSGIDLDEARLLLAAMGLPAADTVLGSSTVVGALGVLAAGIGQLPAAVDALIEADAAEDSAAIVAAVAELVVLLKGAATGVEALVTAFTAGATGDAADEIAAFASGFPERFFGYALATHLERNHVTTAGLARLFQLIESTQEAATVHAPGHTRHVIRFDQMGEVLSDPVGVLAELYRWGTPDLDTAGFFDRLVDLFAGVETAFVEPDPVTGSSVIKLGLVEIGLTPDAVPPTDGTDPPASADLMPGIRARLVAAVPAMPDVHVPIGPNLAIEVGLESDLEPDLTIDLRPPANLIITPPSLTEFTGRARIGISATDITLLGKAGGSRIEAAELRAAVGAELTWDPAAGLAAGAFLAEAAIQGGKVVLSLGGADSFLRGLMPGDGLELDFDLLIGWSEARGLYFDGGANLAIDLPARFSVGPVKVNSLHLGLLLDPSGIGIEASGSASARLGPIMLDVEPMGAVARLAAAPAGGGNLGFADFDIDFRPPTGLRMSLNAGVAKGGGFLAYDEAAKEYSGALELALGPISIKAIGILTTELPDGSDGWALLLLVFSEFKGFQLGFGFTLDGVGGVIGLQHGVSTGALRSGLGNGSLDAVLFPANPVRDAPTLLDRLRAVFPIVPRALTVGPALKIGWGTPSLITIKLGVILQFDEVLGATVGPPTIERVVLLGTLELKAPPARPGSRSTALVQLKVALVGSYELNEKSLAIDARLYDSHVGFASLSGTMVVRARFGDRPNLIAAVGGFHPRFRDIPPGIGHQQRVGYHLRYGEVSIGISGYVALTTNTFQIGADASLVAKGGNFTVTASLGFDALFVLEPVFRFAIDIRVNATVKWKKWTLTSVQVTGSLSGPGRWNVNGYASFKVLLWRPKVRFDESWGRSENTARPSIDLGLAVAEALRRPEAWSARLPGGVPLVTLVQPELETAVVAHPLSELTVLQSVAPLGVTVQRVGQATVTGRRNVAIEAVEIGDESFAPRSRKEHFARSQYLDLSESQKLSSPSFERFDAGTAVASDGYTVGADVVDFGPDWETADLGRLHPTAAGAVDPDLLAGQTRFSAAAHSVLRSRFPDPGLKVENFLPSYSPDSGPAPTGTAPAARGVGVTAEPTTYTEAGQRARELGVMLSERAEMSTR